MTFQSMAGIYVLASSAGAEYAAKHAMRERIRNAQERLWLTENLRGQEIDRFIDRMYGIHARHAEWLKKRGLW